MSEPLSGWGREFDEPIALPDGRKLIVLRDAASYITALPKKEADTPEWQAAIEALMLVVDGLRSPVGRLQVRHTSWETVGRRLPISPCQSNQIEVSWD
jgi:hypothetical protein